MRAKGRLPFYNRPASHYCGKMNGKIVFLLVVFQILSHISLNKCKRHLQMFRPFLGMKAGAQIINHNDIPPFFVQILGKVSSQKPAPTCYQYLLFHTFLNTTSLMNSLLISSLLNCFLRLTMSKGKYERRAM